MKPNCLEQYEIRVLAVFMLTSLYKTFSTFQMSIHLSPSKQKALVLLKKQYFCNLDGKKGDVCSFNEESLTFTEEDDLSS